MKSLKIALIATGIAFSINSYSQDTLPRPDTTRRPRPDTVKINSATTQTLPQPNFGRYYIAVLGSYQSSSSEEQKTVTVSGDEQNAGKIWIEGLTAEKIYALRKPGVGFYKIPVQKEGDQSIAEGTVLYDDNSKQVSICVGCKYVDANPVEAFTKTDENISTKKKANAAKATKVISFTGTKADAGTAKM